MSDKKYYMLCGIIGLTLCFLYLISTGDLEYGYYQFLRIVSLVLIPVFIGIYGWFVKESENVFDFVNIPTGAILILFNPILPIYLEKETWVILDIICAMIFFAIVIYIVFLYLGAKKESEKEPIYLINFSDEEWEHLYKNDFETFWNMAVKEYDLSKLPDRIGNLRDDTMLYGEEARNCFLSRLKGAIEPSNIYADKKWYSLIQLKRESEENNQNTRVYMLDIIREYEHRYIKY